MPIPTNYPGTIINEIDNSSQPTQSFGSYAATMGRAIRGIANAKVLVNTPQDLIAKFGPPVVSGSYPLVSAMDYGIYAGLEALKETGNLWYVRLVDGSEKYAGVLTSGTYTTATITSANSATSIAVIAATASTSISGIAAAGYVDGNTPSDINDLVYGGNLPNTLRFNAIGPGSYGNQYSVSVTSATSACEWWNLYDDMMSSATSATSVAAKIIKINVYTTPATTASIPMETFYASTDYMMVDSSGKSLFVEDVINGNSKYIFVKSAITNGAIPAGVGATPTILQLANGADATSTSPIGVGAGLLWQSLFANKERNPIDVAILIPRTKDAQSDTVEVTNVDALLSNRYDFVAVTQVGGLSSTAESNIVTDNEGIQGAMSSNPSYFAKYYGWTLVYDGYNASRVYLPNCIFAAAVMLRTDRVSNPWEAPAGIERGIITSGKQNKDITPDLGGRLYDKNLNTIKYVNNIGNAIWGQKTAQLRNTARNRINVRRALLYIEKNVEAILNGFLFRGNTVKERERVSSYVNSFMQTVIVGGGVQSYKIVCDGSNNNSSSNTLVVDLYIQPTYTIEFIKLNTVISTSSVTFSEG